MTNAPEHFESYVLPDDVEKVEYTADPKVPSSGTFKIEREDHTLGNMLRMQLYRDPDVVFVGYKHPHPIQHHNILLRVQTASKPTTGEIYTPPVAVGHALVDIINEIKDLSNQVRAQPALRNHRNLQD